jgi:hypothetical protein
MIYQQGLSRRLDHPFLHGSRYFIAFLEDDPEEMERQVNWAAGKTGTEDSLLADQSDTEAFFGRFAKARNLSRRVVESAVRHGQTDLVGQWQINGALREALVGNNGRARQQASLALSRASTQVSREVAGVVFAMTGDSVRAKGLGQELTRSFPYDTMQINFWRPITLAAVQMSSNSPARALDELRAAAPYEMGEQLPLLAAYLRGQAYLALHRGPEAAVEFQKLIDHRGLVGNRVYASLARLGAARSFWMESDTVKARAAYNDFFKLWRNADPDIPVLIAARAEYAKLK